MRKSKDDKNNTITTISLLNEVENQSENYVMSQK